MVTWPEVIQGVHIQPLALEFQNERKDTVALKASGLPSFLAPPKTLYGILFMLQFFNDATREIS